MIILNAPAKINLTLDILGTRPDGYHEMYMVMQSVSLYDRLSLEYGGGGGVRVETGVGYLPLDRKNLAVSAAYTFYEAMGREPEDLVIHLEKHIPVCAGTAGGSSDAAAVLRGLNELTGAGLSPAELARIGAAVGSDVPYCVMGTTMLAAGRGEILSPLPPLPPCHILLCKPPFPISTPALFKEWDRQKRRLRPDTDGLITALTAGDLPGVARRIYNVFEAVLSPHHRREIDRIKNAMIQAGALGSAMTGSGPTVFGLFDDPAAANAAAELLGQQYQEVFLTEPV